jgi:hypothetical protein
MPHFIKIAGIVLGLLCTWLSSGAIQAETELETRQVVLAESIKIGDRIGHVRFLGMLELPDITRNGLRLSQLSGLAWDDDDGILFAISDKDSLFHLRPEFENNTLAGVKLLRAVPLVEPGSGKTHKRSRADSEGLDILNGRNGRRGDTELVIGFERFPRIARYRPDGSAIGEYPLPEPINDAKNYLGPNKVLESVCVDSALGVMTTPEAPLKNEREGHTRLFSLSGLSWLYPFAPGDRITALECLGRSEVLVLQQNFQNPFGRIVVTLKRVHLTADSPTRPLSPEPMMTLDSNSGFQIDNFEGLARHQGKRFFMVSDNNDLFIQRSLLMYFELLDE